MNNLDKENLHKEIDLIQACINRMANNSFLLKGWAISIIAVVLALTDKDVSPLFLCLIVVVPLLCFWYLDAFFLYTEKLYRKMYEWVIEQRPLNNRDNMYDLDPRRFKDKVFVKKNGHDTSELESVWTVMGSVTLRTFYLIPVAIIVLIVILQLFKVEMISSKKTVPEIASHTLTIKLAEQTATPTTAVLSTTTGSQAPSNKRFFETRIEKRTLPVSPQGAPSAKTVTN